MNIRQSLFAGALAAAVMTPIVAGAAGSDRSFVTQALTGNSSEIRQGEIFANSTDPRIQSFAQRMTTDHSEANTQLIALAHDMHVSTTGQLPEFPYTSGVQHPAWLTPQVKAKAMAGLTPVAYFDQQIRVHQQAIALYKQEISGGTDRRVVSYARKTLPVIEQHLALAQRDLRAEKAAHHD
jgi:putative membrane protein